jgi:hypothetical protein
MSVIKISTNKKENEDLLAKSLSRDYVSKILGTVTYERSFQFFDGTAKPTGEFAVSLSDFCNKIRTLSSECLAFHLKRRDFQKWISEVIGDVELAGRLNKIKVKNSALRDTLYAFVSSRIQELKEAWLILLVLQ